MKKNNTARLDLIIISIIVVVGVMMALLLFLGKESGNRVQIRVDGKITAEYSLSRDASYEIQGINGGINQLVIEDGKAWVVEASCPDGICVNMGVIDTVGQSIVCLPNKVVVEVISLENKDQTKLDVVVGKYEKQF